jgi:hypothetical protein
MSSETINAENRNNPLFNSMSSCFFCRSSGHNIRNCNSISLIRFEELCIQKYRSFGIPCFFRNWLINFVLIEVHMVKAYSIRYCGAENSTNIMICLQLIETRISNLVLRINNQHIQYDNSDNEMFNELFYSFLDILGTQLQTEICRETKFNIGRKIIECSDNENYECNICYEKFEKKNFIKLNCNHEFCKNCLKKTLESTLTVEPFCAYCRAEIKNMEITSQDICDEFNEILS